MVDHPPATFRPTLPGLSPVRLRGLLLNRYLLFLAGVYLYLHLTDAMIEVTRGVWRMEMPLLLYAYFSMNGWVRASRWQGWVAAAPWAAFYLMHDYYFLRFFRIPKLIEVTQIPELLAVLGTGELLTYVTLIVGFCALMIAFVRFSVRGLVRSLPLLAVFAAPFLLPEEFVRFYAWRSIEVIHYSSVINVEYNGRLASILYNEAMRRQVRKNLSQYRNQEQLSLLLPPELERKPQGGNVHLVLLESFIDPSLFTKLPREKQPIHPDFAALFGPMRGTSYSPVFGGYTAQAEFEFLCGVPAMQEFDEIEFNSFTGKPTYCLPNILKEFGYRTVGTHGYKPDFFNTVAAYNGLGFDKTHFPVEYTPGSDSYLSKGEEENNKYIFDGMLYDQNRAFVQTLKEKPGPIFNFILTVYGHLPFDYGNRVGPPVVSIPEVDPVIERILNQHYYRGKAAADHVKQLMTMDPHSLIILVADHLPPFPRGEQDLDALGYAPDAPDRLHRNLLYVFRDGKPVTYENFMHYNVYRLILDYVTGGEYCRMRKCDYSYPQDKEAYRDDYRIIMGLATR